MGENLESPRLEDLPKVDDKLGEEIASPHELKHVTPEEKFVLPTAEDVAAEKYDDQLKTEIKNFDAGQLHHTEPEEKHVLPSPDEENERSSCDEALIDSLENGVREILQEDDLDDDNNAPQEDIEMEKKHEDFKRDIESFPAEKLKPTETEEKSVLPSPDEIRQEKVRQLAAAFDHGQLKHVVPVVKHGLPGSEEIGNIKAKDLAAKFGSTK